MELATNLSSLRIVLVDADPGTRGFLKEALQRDLGHEVVGEANNGTNMVRTVLMLEPDVVIFNVHLPHVNGLEALRQINASRPVAAIAFASNLTETVLRQAVEVGLETFLMEPVAIGHLGPALQIAWARFNERRQLRKENASLQQTLKNRKIVERAKGVLMKRYRWSEDQAFRRLQRGAMSQRMPMVDLAQAVLNGQPVDLPGVELGAPAESFVLAAASH